jgi:hypothetical protein
VSLVTSAERARARADVSLLIEASGLVAELHRRTAALKSRFGEEDSTYADTGVRFAFEWRPEPKERIEGQGAMKPDAEIHVLPGLDIREEDRIKHGGVFWKALNVVEENLFGVITHKLVRLARVY